MVRKSRLVAVGTVAEVALGTGCATQPIAQAHIAADAPGRLGHAASGVTSGAR
ncbi:hypothetical protein [Streptomyces murinus]|uniref:hypothetical protein n=1 Tax=Streptomyces murinus TaxID=33900 RepID=UPI003805DA0C